MNASNVGVIVTVEVDASTVQRGDQLMVGGYLFTVSDMITLAQGAKRLEFTTGESFTMRPLRSSGPPAVPRLGVGGGSYRVAVEITHSGTEGELWLTPWGHVGQRDGPSRPPPACREHVRSVSEDY